MPRGSWTAEAVELALVQCFSSSIVAELRTSSRSVFVPLAHARGATTDELLGLTAGYLGRTSQERKYLLNWARAQAGVGASLSETCREMGWSRSTVERCRREAAQKVADGLNKDGVPVRLTIDLTMGKPASDPSSRNHRAG